MNKPTVKDAMYLLDKYYNEALVYCPYVKCKVTYALKKALEEMEEKEKRYYERFQKVSEDA